MHHPDNYNAHAASRSRRVHITAGALVARPPGGFNEVAHKMSYDVAKRWNERYEGEKETWLRNQPNQLLLDFSGELPPSGRVLDAAAGVGTNALHLALMGFNVSLLDISLVGLRFARARFSRAGLGFKGAVVDLGKPWLPEGYFDIILNFRFLERATLPMYRRALKPGGIIFFEGFVRTGGEKTNQTYYLHPGELLAEFHNFEIVFYDQQRRERNRWDTYRLADRLVARKPCQG